MDLYQEVVHKTRYARWIYDEGRRETWDETVDRLHNFWFAYITDNYGCDMEKFRILREAMLYIKRMEIMPSMRTMMTAGKALEEEHIAAYNCAYLPVDSINSLAEILHILMCGTGVGFSVENKYVDRLPVVGPIVDSPHSYTFDDSRSGWSNGYLSYLRSLYNGVSPILDYTKIRKAGSPLRTFGGRASGPIPLNRLCQFTKTLFKRAEGRKLSSLEVHDLVCEIASAVIVGGVRRSALISLSDLSNTSMAIAKRGDWWEVYPNRRYANNSAVFEGRPTSAEFLTEWNNLYESRSGERGFFNREAANKKVKANGRRDPDLQWGTNPCSEIILRPNEFCNLSEVVVRPYDDSITLRRKVELATFIGCLQSTLIDFNFIGSKWRDNCNNERLLGVSLTGIMDHHILSNPSDRTAIELARLRDHAVNTAKVYAKDLGIKTPVAVTCVKPSGTVSSLVNSASGLHARWSPYYIRSIRQSVNDPVTRLLIEAGVPHEQAEGDPSTEVFYFPQKSPEGAKTRNEVTAMQQLEHWKMLNDHWCEHKPSITVTLRDHEWEPAGDWVWNNFDELSGLAFLPHDGGSYNQAPLQECTREEYEHALAEMPSHINWSRLYEYEGEDHTTASQEYACVGGQCEIV